MKLRGMRFVVLGVLLVGCGAPVAVEVTPTVAETMTVEPLTMTPSLEPSAAATRRASLMATVEPTATLALSTATQGSPPPLTIRRPTIEQLESYLMMVYPSDFYDGYVADEDMIYLDVSGDGNEDLTVVEFLGVIVMVWKGDHYADPFRIHDEYWKYDPGSRVWLQDWTGDGVSEVIYDLRSDNGGPGYTVTEWHRNVIYCHQDECSVAWRNLYGRLIRDLNTGGMSLYRAEHQLQLPTLRSQAEGFRIHCCQWEVYDTKLPMSGLNVFTSTLSTFSWNGSIFELADEQAVGLPSTVESAAALSATSASGEIANIEAEPNHLLGNWNDICRLFVEGESVGSAFGCRDNFTTIAWQDITNDGFEELVVQAFSSAFPLDAQVNELSDLACAHQHLLVFAWGSTEAYEIANVEGCVVQSDLYGVRLEDVDGDGQLEIVAADSWFTPSDCVRESGCWYELGYANQIYKWNGSTFAFWKEVAVEETP